MQVPSDSEKSCLQEHSLPIINPLLLTAVWLRSLQLHHVCKITWTASPWWPCHVVCKHQLARQGYFGNPSVTGNDPNLAQIYERIIWIKNSPVFHSRAGSVLLLFITATISMSPELSPSELQTLISIILFKHHLYAVVKKKMHTTAYSSWDTI